MKIGARRHSLMIGMGLLFISLWLVYSNTFKASWQFDDLPNIVQNPSLHIQNLAPDSLIRTFFSHPSKPGALYRPVPCLTFALNWYFSPGNPRAFHITNVALHWLNACLLYYFITLLIKRWQGCPQFIQSNAYCIGLLAAIFWALHPIQTQAVTYIVQRMSAMATTFFLISLIFYVKARFAHHTATRVGLMVLTFLSFLLAVGSKENSIMLPFSIVLIEVTFFKYDSLLPELNLPINKVWPVFMVLILTVGVALIPFYEQTSFGSILKGYQSRPFTHVERILTQPRVLLFYLSQIAWPHPGRFSVEHAFVLSRSILTPWYTFPSLVGVGALAGMGLLRLRRNPLFWFPVLFFFLNHVVESSFLPLEMVFEHRNYLPSLFLFMPISIGMLYAMHKATKRIWFKSGVLMVIAVLIAFLGLSTFIRNKDWQTPFRLWTDAHQKAPDRARPLHKLGVIVGWQESAGPHQWRSARGYFTEALKRDTHKSSVRADLMGNMALLCEKLEDYSCAQAFIHKALKLRPNYRKFRYDAARISIKSGQWIQALSHNDVVVKTGGRRAAYFVQRGHILMHLGRIPQALQAVKQALRYAPENHTALNYLALCLLGEGNIDAASNLFGYLHRRDVRDIWPVLGMIETGIIAKKFELANQWTKHLLTAFALTHVKKELATGPPSYTTPPVNRALLGDFVGNMIPLLAKNEN